MKKILLIEDNEELRENTAELLELSGYNVEQAPNGKEGVRLARQKPVDLIICDIMMPEMDGYGVLFALSKDPELVKIPFVFLTAKSDRSDFRKGMNMGADDYIAKPFNDIELLDAIESRLKKAESRSQETQDKVTYMETARHQPAKTSLRLLSEKARVKPFSKKDPVFTEGGYPHYLFQVRSGKIKTFRRNDFGKDYITGLYRPGDFLGYTALLEEAPYQESASVLEESEVAMIPKDDFFRLLHDHPEVSRQFIRLLSNSVQEKEEQLLKLAYNSVRKRVAEALVTLQDRYQSEEGGEEAPFSIKLSREDLASLAGTAKETAIRTLADFKEEGLVAVHAGNITILRPEKLRRMPN
jgi:CRP-like cAMP-binding protein/CheY-like chemotaxis protein